MADKEQAPVLAKAIPTIKLQVGSPFKMDFKEFIESPPEKGPLRFSALLSDGRFLPEGLECTEDGILKGTVKEGDLGDYNITLTIENDSETPLIIWAKLSINPSLEPVEKLKEDFSPQLEEQIGKALGDEHPPKLKELIGRPITSVEIYYLLQRYASLIIWDVFNLETPGPKVILDLPGNSPHYHIYDRGSCLVAAPKDLYSFDRTLKDALTAATIMAREVYKRGWTIEFAGFNKMARAAWVELQLLGDIHGKSLEIFHYQPSPQDIKVYSSQVGLPRLGMS